MKLVIERETWLRGEGNTSSYLFRKADGKKCCLGFLALECGLTQEQIGDITAVSFLELNGIEVPEKLDFLVKEGTDNVDSKAAVLLMNTNDSIATGDLERETALTKLFDGHDIQVEFV